MLKADTFLENPIDFPQDSSIIIKDELHSFSSTYSYFITIKNTSLDTILKSVYIKVLLTPRITSFYDETIRDYVMIDTKTDYFLGIIPLENINIGYEETSTNQIIIIDFNSLPPIFVSKNFYLKFINFYTIPQNINIKAMQIFREIIR